MRHSSNPARARLARAGLLALAAASLGCEAYGLLGLQPGPLATLSIDAVDGRRVVLVNGQLQLFVEGRDANNLWVSVESPQFISLDTALARVSAQGVVRGRKVGDARIEARVGQLTAVFVAQVRASFCSPSKVTGMITPGGTVSGHLSVDDCALPQGGTADGTVLVVSTGGLVRVALTDESEAERVWVTTTSGDTIPTGLLPVGLPIGSQRATLVSIAAGTYHVWVATPTDLGSAGYSYRADLVESCSSASTGAIALASEHAGVLDWDDCVLATGHPADRFTLSVPTARTIAVSLEGDGFAPNVFLPALAPDGPHIVGWFFPQGDRQVHLLHLPAGETALHVFSGAQSPLIGTYRIALSEPVPCESNAPGPLVASGDTVAGSLGLEDCFLMENGNARLAERWRVTLPAESAVRFDLLFAGGLPSDPSLRFRGPDGTGVHFEFPVISPGHRRAQVRLPAGTSEVLVVTDYSLSAYRLAVTVVP